MKTLHVYLILVTLSVAPLAGHGQTNGMTRFSNGLFQFYGNGTWTSVDQGNTSVTCSVAGQFRFDTGTSSAQFCNGTTWRTLNSGSTSAGGGSAGMTKYANGQFMYHNGSNWVVGGQSPMHRWKLDETSGTTIADSAPSPINGTMTNAAGVTSDPARDGRRR